MSRSLTVRERHKDRNHDHYSARTSTSRTSRHFHKDYRIDDLDPVRVDYSMRDAWELVLVVVDGEQESKEQGR